MPTEDNWTVIRIWLPHDHDGNFVVAHAGTRESVGHASLEIPGEYASFWPVAILPGKKGEKNPQKADRDGVFLDNFQADLIAEQGRFPDLILVLYSLDLDAIRKKMAELKATVKYWHVQGEGGILSAIVRVFSPKTEIFTEYGSCSNIVYRLLVAGGIEKRLGFPPESDFVSNTCNIQSPDGVARMVIYAANIERRNFPETARFIQPFTSSFQVPERHLDYNPHSWKIGRVISGGSGGAIPDSPGRPIRLLQNTAHIIEAMRSRIEGNLGVLFGKPAIDGAHGGAGISAPTMETTMNQTLS